MEAGPPQDLLDLPWGQGLGEQEPLAPITALLLDVFELRGLLDALCDGHEIEGLAEMDEGVKEVGTGSSAELGHEGPVDLQDVRGEFPQVGQGGVARAEVVYGYAHTEFG